jgi:hypothetical protein
VTHYVLVTGGREPSDYVRDDIEATLTILRGLHGADLAVMHGAAPGVDTWAQEICEELGIRVRGYPADWGRGPVGGLERNTKMVTLLVSWLSRGHTAQVVAFPGGRGTNHCTKTAEAAGLDVSQIVAGATPEPART